MHTRCLRHIESFSKNNSDYSVYIIEKEDDELMAAYFDLFYRCFGRRPHLDRKWYTWCYCDNPLGKANNYLLMDIENNTLAGTYSLGKLNVFIGGNEVDGMVGINGMIDERYRGRGLYSKLIETTVRDSKPMACYALPHGKNTGSIHGHYNAGWRNIKNIYFYKKTNTLSSADMPAVKIIGTFKGMRNSDIEDIANRNGVCFHRSVDYLEWRYFKRPHRRYDVIALFDGSNYPKAYMVLSYYKGTSGTRCQIAEYGIRSYGELLQLLKKAEYISRANCIEELDLWLDDYDSDRSIFEAQGFEQTDEYYEMMVHGEGNSVITSDIKVHLGDLDAV